MSTHSTIPTLHPLPPTSHQTSKGELAWPLLLLPSPAQREATRRRTSLGYSRCVGDDDAKPTMDASSTTPPHIDRPPPRTHQAPELAAAGAWEMLATEARLALAFLLQSEEQQQRPQQPPLPPPALRSPVTLAAALGFGRRLWACEGDPWAGRRMEEETEETFVVPLHAPSAGPGAAASVYEACLQVRGRSGAPPGSFGYTENARDLITPLSFTLTLTHRVSTPSCSS